MRIKGLFLEFLVETTERGPLGKNGVKRLKMTK
jgi:hypothetical protein